MLVYLISNVPLIFHLQPPSTYSFSVHKMFRDTEYFLDPQSLEQLKLYKYSVRSASEPLKGNLQY